MALFSFSDPISLNLEDASIVYYPVFYSEKSADNLFQTVLNKTPWQQDLITVYGKTYNQPRLTAFYSNTKNALEYSNIKMDPHPFSDCLTSIKNKIEKEVNRDCSEKQTSRLFKREVNCFHKSEIQLLDENLKTAHYNWKSIFDMLK